MRTINLKIFIRFILSAVYLLPFWANAQLSTDQKYSINQIQLAMRDVSFGLYAPSQKASKARSHKKNTKLISKKSVRVTSKAKPQKKAKKKLSYCLDGSYKKLAQKVKKHQKSITAYSRKYAVSESLIKAIITAESCFNERAVSPKGAHGLMQLMPATAKRFGVTDRFNADLNIKAGTRYLQFLLDYYEEDILNAIAAYNAGEGAVDKYKGIPPYNETKLYVRKVAALYKLYSQGGGQLNASLVSLLNDRSLKKSVFMPRAMYRSRFSPYRGRSKNITWGRCANRTSTHLKQSTKVQSGRGVWQRIYIAQRGDTLLRVMQKTGIHKNKIAQMNGLRSRAKLKPGQRLLVWECRKR